jgi:hypothetical protein
VKQTEFKAEREKLMVVSIVVSILLSSVLVLILMSLVSGWFFLLWLPLVVGLTFAYQSLGYLAEEFLRDIRAESFKEELQPWTMKERLEAIIEWPIRLLPLIIWYAAKGSFNTIWGSLTEEAETQNATAKKTSKVNP